MADRPHRTPSRSQRKRSAARFYAVQALFQMEAADASLEEVRAEFEAHRVGAELDGVTFAEADIAHFRRIITAAVEHQARIDQMTDRALVERWPIDRIDPTVRALFRAAGAELVACDTPPKVAINEFVEVAAAFFPEGREPKFVNAVLDHIARETHPEAFS